jgi:hypothetical protein
VQVVKDLRLNLYKENIDQLIDFAVESEKLVPFFFIYIYKFKLLK